MATAAGVRPISASATPATGQRPRRPRRRVLRPPPPPGRVRPARRGTEESIMTLDARVDRRQFLRVSALAGGGLLLGTIIDFGGADLLAADAPKAPAAEFSPNAFIRLSPD